MNGAAEFAAELDAFVDEVVETNREIFVGCTEAIRSSIQEGSPITAAPGQPVAPKDGGNLIGSWEATYEGWQSLVATNVEYAEAVEERQQPPYTTASGKLVTPRPMHFRSEVGGAHSVALTYAGFGALADQVVGQVVRE